ncbi:phage tail spike protein [Clostridium felsineum]|uniref:phage tail spike protein n=1 Tax=Clostridium felsineum TaxID=36839 RepID=UPI00098CA720|nr:phage tail spike protein [Clostridium felsineum]URZ15337.1 hypothetical protein CLFE_013550 [Clostridium felsineum DSM 794]
MVLLLDTSRNKIGNIDVYKDMSITKEVKKLDNLSIYIPITDPNYNVVAEEYYIRTKDNEYVIKEININDDNYKELYCEVNVEELKGTLVEDFNQVQGQCEGTANLALSYTNGWSVAYCDVNKKRNVVKKQCTVYDIIQEIQDIYKCDIVFNAINKEIFIYQSVGSDKGVYFTEELNLKQLQLQSNTNDYITQLIPIGNNNMTIESVNNNLKYISNYQYTTKVIQAYWIDNRYTIPQDLYEDAVERLNELSKPKRSYSVSVIDLAKINKDYAILDFDIGDSITLLSKSKKIRDNQRIKKITIYPDEPEKNTVEISNILDNIEDLITRFDNTSNTVDTVTNSDGSIDGNKVDGINGNQIVDKSISSLQIGNEAVGTAQIALASIGNAQIDRLSANKLVVDTADIKDGAIQHAKLGDAVIESANIADEAVTSAKIQNEAVGTAQIAKEAVGNAQIANMDVSKLNAGDLNADIIHMVSGDNRLQLKGNKLQLFADNNGQQERVLLGQQDNGDYGLLVRGSDGQTVLFNENGQTKEGFTDGYGKLDDKSLDPKKIDIEKVVTEINGATTKIQSSSVIVDNKSLDTKFTEITETVDNIQIGGTNLLRNSDFSKGENFWNNITEIVDDSIYGKMALYNLQSAQALGVQSLLIQHGTYTMSAIVKANDFSKVTGIGFVFFYTDNSYTDYTWEGHQWIDLGNGYKKVITTGATDTNKTLSRVDIRIYTQGNNTLQFQVGKMKFEKGNKATDWSPAPEDVQTQIDTNTTNIEETATQIGFNLESQTWRQTDNLETFKDFQTFLQAQKGKILASVSETDIEGLLIKWTNIVGVSINGTTLTATGANNNWGSTGCSSIQTLSNGQYVECVLNAQSKRGMIGLSHTDIDQNYNTIQFALYPDLDGNNNPSDWVVYENGTWTKDLGNWNVGDTGRIAIEDNKINYYINGNLKYTSTQTPTLPLVVDTAFYIPNTQFVDVKIDSLVNIKSTIEQSPDAVKIGFNGITNKIQMDTSGLHINDGAIDIKNNVGNVVFSSDSNGDLNLRGSITHYDSNGQPAIQILNNSLKVYDWSRSGDFVGGVQSYTNTGGAYAGRGGIEVYADQGNPLSLSYSTNTGTYTFLKLDDTKQETGNMARGAFLENVDFVNYSRQYFYGSDFSIPCGSVGLSGDNDLWVSTKQGYNIILGYYQNNDGGGNSGVYTKVTSTELTQRGDIWCTGKFYSANGDGGAYYLIPRTNQDSTGIQLFYENGGNLIWQKNNGELRYSVGINASDKALKKNIVDSTENYLDIVNKFKLHEFDYNGKMGTEGHVKAGIITQEAEKINKGFTQTWAKDIDDTEYKCPNWSAISPYLIGAIQQLSNKNNQLEKENNALKERLDQLENKINKLLEE